MDYYLGIFFKLLFTYYMCIFLGGINQNLTINKLIISINTVIIVTLLFLIFRKYIKVKAIKKFFLTSLLSVILFFSLYIVLTLSSSSSQKMVMFSTNSVKKIIMIFIALSAGEFYGLWFVMKAISIGGVYTSFSGIIDWWENSYRFTNSFYRSVGNLGNPNIQGQSIVVSLSVFLYMIKDLNKESIYRRLLDAITIIIMLTGVFLTQSRGALMGMLILLSIHLFFSNKWIFKTKIFLLCGTFFAGIGSIFFVKTFLPDYYMRFQVLGDSDISNGRLEALLLGIENISVFGLGIGNTNNNLIGLSSHNTIVNILEECGFIFAPVLIIITMNLCLNLRYLWKTGFFYIGTGSFLILFFNFFTHNLLYMNHTYVIWVIIVLLKNKKVYMINEY